MSKVWLIRYSVPEEQVRHKHTHAQKQLFKDTNPELGV